MLFRSPIRSGSRTRKEHGGLTFIKSVAISVPHSGVGSRRNRVNFEFAGANDVHFQATLCTASPYGNGRISASFPEQRKTAQSPILSVALPSLFGIQFHARCHVTTKTPTLIRKGLAFFQIRRRTGNGGLKQNDVDPKLRPARP